MRSGRSGAGRRRLADAVACAAGACGRRWSVAGRSGALAALLAMGLVLVPLVAPAQVGGSAPAARSAAVGEAVAPAGTEAAVDPAALVRAAKAGDAAAVRALLAAGASADAAELDGSSALLWASHHDDLDSVRRLIDADADVNAANDLGATPLWAASENRSAAIVGMLLRAGADPDRALLSGETPIMVAARAGGAEVVAQLAAAGADLDRQGSRGQTALMWAAAQGHAAVVAALLAAGADLSLRSDVWTQVMAVPPHSRPEYNREIPHGGNTALLFAVRAGDLPSARVLVAAGADVDDADAWGVSAAVLAAHGGHRELLTFLLAAGADPNEADAGFAALHDAVMRNDAPMVAALLAHGADPDQPLRTWTPTRRASRDHHYPPPFVGASPFWLAARFARTDLMRLLADHGADPHVVHEVDYIVDGRLQWRTERTTALMAAFGMGGRRARPWAPLTGGTAESRTLDAVKLAVELGIDVNAVDATGQTVLDEAEALQYESVVQYLVEVGAEPGAN